MASGIYENILREVDQLTDDERRDLVATLGTASTYGIPGTDLLALLDTLPPIESDALDEMERIIQEDCERVDPSAW